MYASRDLYNHLKWWREENPFKHDGLMFSDLEGKPLTPSWWRYNFIHAMKSIGQVREIPGAEWTDSRGIKRRRQSKFIPLFVPHELRHSRASDLSVAGINDAILREMFGWSSAEIQDNYTHIDAIRQREAFLAAEEKLRNI